MCTDTVQLYIPNPTISCCVWNFNLHSIHVDPVEPVHLRDIHTSCIVHSYSHGLNSRPADRQQNRKQVRCKVGASSWELYVGWMADEKIVKERRAGELKGVTSQLPCRLLLVHCTLSNAVGTRVQCGGILAPCPLRCSLPLFAFRSIIFKVECTITTLCVINFSHLTCWMPCTYIYNDHKYFSLFPLQTFSELLKFKSLCTLQH